MTSGFNPSLPRIAVVEDDLDLQEIFLEYLHSQGFSAWGSNSAEAFYRRLSIDPVDVVVLDVGLPGEDGLSVTRHLNKLPSISVIIVSARGTLDDRLNGLRSGADRYLLKPIDLGELVANIQALGRRQVSEADSTVLTPELKNASDFASSSGMWRLERRDWRLIDPAGKSVTLTTREFTLMLMLVEAHGQTVTRKALANEMCGPFARNGSERLDVVLARLRKKANEAFGPGIPIKNVHQVGYVFSAPAILD